MKKLSNRLLTLAEQLDKADPRRRIAIKEAGTIAEKAEKLALIAKELASVLGSKEMLPEDLMFEVNTDLWQTTAELAEVRKRLNGHVQRIKATPSLKLV